MAKTVRASPSATRSNRSTARPRRAVLRRLRELPEARCGRSRRPAGTGAASQTTLFGWRTQYDGNFVAITRSIGRPSASVRSSSRQRNAWSSTRVPGYHLYGIAHRLGLVPASAQLVDELVGHHLGPAVDERHLRPADRDSHCLGCSSRAMRSSRSSISLSDGVVERALVGERRLDVPAHEAAQEELDRPAPCRRSAARPRPPTAARPGRGPRAAPAPA